MVKELQADKHNGDVQGSDSYERDVFDMDWFLK